MIETNSGAAVLFKLAALGGTPWPVPFQILGLSDIPATRRQRFSRFLVAQEAGGVGKSTAARGLAEAVPDAPIFEIESMRRLVELGDRVEHFLIRAKPSDVRETGGEAALSEYDEVINGLIADKRPAIVDVGANGAEAVLTSFGLMAATFARRGRQVGVLVVVAADESAYSSAEKLLALSKPWASAQFVVANEHRGGIDRSRIDDFAKGATVTQLASFSIPKAVRPLGRAARLRVDRSARRREAGRSVGRPQRPSKLHVGGQRHRYSCKLSPRRHERRAARRGMVDRMNERLERLVDRFRAAEAAVDASKASLRRRSAEKLAELMLLSARQRLASLQDPDLTKFDREQLERSLEGDLATRRPRFDRTASFPNLLKRLVRYHRRALLRGALAAAPLAYFGARRVGNARSSGRGRTQGAVQSRLGDAEWLSYDRRPGSRYQADLGVGERPRPPAQVVLWPGLRLERSYSRELSPRSPYCTSRTVAVLTRFLLGHRDLSRVLEDADRHKASCG